MGYDSLGTNKRNKTCQRNENTILTQSSLTLLFYLFIYFPQASRAGGLAYKILYWKKRHEIKYFFFFLDRSTPLTLCIPLTLYTVQLILFFLM